MLMRSRDCIALGRIHVEQMLSAVEQTQVLIDETMDLIRHRDEELEKLKMLRDQRSEIRDQTIISGRIARIDEPVLLTVSWIFRFNR